jgi:hypothetical protein
MIETQMTVEEFVHDIRLRIRYAPEFVGNDTRALPPVDWAARVLAEQKEQEEWEQQFDDVKSGRTKI